MATELIIALPFWLFGAEQVEHAKFKDDCGGLFQTQAQEVRTNSHARRESVSSG